MRQTSGKRYEKRQKGGDNFMIAMGEKLTVKCSPRKIALFSNCVTFHISFIKRLNKRENYSVNSLNNRYSLISAFVRPCFLV